MNPISNIRVMDMPLRIRACFPTLSSGDDSEAIDQGFIVSEVGQCVPTTLDSYSQTFGTYMLRAPRQNQAPAHLFGKCQLGQTYSAFIPQLIDVPAVGSSITINPQLTAGQARMVSMYNYMSADVYYIIHIPSPLGVGVYLHVYAPELDGGTVTRGIRFKPSSVNTISVCCPWSNDLMVVPNNLARLGQCGGSIIVKTIENNSLPEVNSPLKMTVFCCVTNIQLAGYSLVSSSGSGQAAINFKPQVQTRAPSNYFVLTAEEYADDTPGTTDEVMAEGGALLSEQLDAKATPVAPVVEQLAQDTGVTLPGMASNMSDTRAVAAKWINYKSIELRSPATLTWSTLTIDPYSDTVLRKAGDNIALAWRRNVWTSGSTDIGYMRTLVVQINIPRPPQLSGTLEVKDSENASSRYLVNFGSRVEIPLMPTRFDGISRPNTHIRDYNNPWMRTNESAVNLHYRLIAFNRTADIANINVTIMLRIGYSTFQVPRKPNRTIPAGLEDTIELFNSMYTREKFTKFAEMTVPYRANSEAQQRDRLMEQRAAEEARKRQEAAKAAQAVSAPHKAVYQADFEPGGLAPSDQFITPYPGDKPESFTLQEDIGEEEDIELDGFPVLLYEGAISQDMITSIPLNLSTIADKFAVSGADNAITQKFLRFANIIPTGEGAFGPIVGGYTIHLRLPTTVAGEILHNCVPGDMADEAATRIFGLSSLASLAGTALSSVGGPLINGIINTAAPVISGAANAIGGSLAGTLADTAINGVKGIVNKVIPTPAQSAANSRAAAVSGDIPVSRYVQMIKYVKDNFINDPVFPTLLLEPRNFWGYMGEKLTTKIPISVFANLRNVKVERNLYDRLVYPEIDALDDDVYLTWDRIGYVVESFVSTKDTFKEGSTPNKWAKKFFAYLQQTVETRSVPRTIGINKIRSMKVPTGTLSNIIASTDFYKYSNLRSKLL